MMKIAHVDEVKRVTGLPQEVVGVVRDIVTILDCEYGEYRDVDSSDGGYVLVIEEASELESLRDIYINIEDVIPEYVDMVEVVDGENYTNTLILLSNDFAVSLIMPVSITPSRFLDEIIPS